MDYLNVEGNWQERIVHLFILDQVMQNWLIISFVLFFWPIYSKLYFLGVFQVISDIIL